jgi:hypothetical protein
MELTLDQAVQNIELALADFNGKLKDHQVLQQSLKVLKDHLHENKEAKNGEVKKED